MKIVFYLFTFILFTHYTYSQDATINADTYQEFNGKEIPELIAAFNETYLKDSLTTVVINKSILQQISTSTNEKNKALGFYTLAKWEKINGNFKEAIAFGNEMIAITEVEEYDELTMLGNLRNGVCFYNLGKFELAVNAYLRALEIAKELDDFGRQIVIQSNIALVKMHVDNPKGAIVILEQVLKSIDDHQEKESRIIIYINTLLQLCNAHTMLKDYEKANHYCEEGITLSKEYNDKEGLAYLLASKGNVEILNGNYDAGLALLDKAATMAKYYGEMENQVSLILLYKAKAYFFKNDYHKTIGYLEQVEDLKSENNFDFIALQEMNSLFAKSYNKLGYKEKAVFYFEKAIAVDDSNDSEKNKINADIIKKYDLQDVQDELIALKQTSKQTSIGLYIILILFVITVISFILFFRYQKEKNAKKFDLLMKELEKKKAVKKSNPSKEIVEKDKLILEKLAEFEAKNLFLNQNSGLKNVADLLETNTAYLSKVINTYKKKSFVNYMIDLRVQYAIKKIMEDKRFRSYTINSIAQEIGFKRSESFSKAFKKETGLYPSFFIKKLNKQDNS